MFSTNYLAHILSVTGVISGGLIVAGITKNTNLKNQIEKEILRECGEIESEGYTQNGEKNFEGRDLTVDAGDNAGGKKNSKGKNGSDYVFECRPKIIKKYNITDKGLNEW